jgi:hypothetical protein
MVHVPCTHVCKWENEPVETIPGIRKGDKGEWWRGEFKYDVFDIL